MTRNLTELLEKKSRTANATPIDWDARRESYLDSVNALYGELQSILSEPIRRRTVTVERRPKQLSETFIGTYTVDDLILMVGNEQVRFSPRGRNIAGAAGRVDVLGDRGEAILVLDDGNRWAFVRTRHPKIETEPLTEESLGEILQTVMRD